MLFIVDAGALGERRTFGTIRAFFLGGTASEICVFGSQRFEGDAVKPTGKLITVPDVVNSYVE